MAAISFKTTDINFKNENVKVNIIRGDNTKKHKIKTKELAGAIVLLKEDKSNNAQLALKKYNKIEIDLLTGICRGIGNGEKRAVKIDKEKLNAKIDDEGINAILAKTILPKLGKKGISYGEDDEREYEINVKEYDDEIIVPEIYNNEINPAKPTLRRTLSERALSQISMKSLFSRPISPLPKPSSPGILRKNTRYPTREELLEREKAAKKKEDSVVSKVSKTLSRLSKKRFSLSADSLPGISESALPEEFIPKQKPVPVLKATSRPLSPTNQQKTSGVTNLSDEEKLAKKIADKKREIEVIKAKLDILVTCENSETVIGFMYKNRAACAESGMPEKIEGIDFLQYGHPRALEEALEAKVAELNAEIKSLQN